MNAELFDDGEVLTWLREYISTRPLPRDIVTVEQVVAITRAIVEFAGVPLVDLTLGEIREFEKQMRLDFRARGVKTIAGNAAQRRQLTHNDQLRLLQTHMALGGAIFAVSLVKDFVRDVVQAKSFRRSA